jgi:hypothetical protein
MEGVPGWNKYMTILALCERAFVEKGEELNMGGRRVQEEWRKDNISIRLPNWMIEALKKEAKKEGIGYTNLVERIVSNYLREKGIISQLRVMRNCSTCEFNFGGTCAGEKYGEPVYESGQEQPCWEPSLSYTIELAKQLPEQDRLVYEYDDNVTIDDLLYRIEKGKWPKAVKSIEKEGNVVKIGKTRVIIAKNS